jgi:hypothetical protein
MSETRPLDRLQRGELKPSYLLQVGDLAPLVRRAQIAFKNYRVHL